MHGQKNIKLSRKTLIVTKAAKQDRQYYLFVKCRWKRWIWSR